MPTPLLEGNVDTRDQEITRLRGQVEDLENDLAISRAETKRATQSASRAVARLRQILTPLYAGLKELFGEMDASGLIDTATAAPTGSPAPADDRKVKVWEAWKNKLPGQASKLIDAMLTHGDCDVEQFVVITGCARRQTTYDAIHKLNKLGLINKNGGKYSLKEL
jgi:hypothetical protein